MLLLGAHTAFYMRESYLLRDASDILEEYISLMLTWSCTDLESMVYNAIHVRSNSMLTYLNTAPFSYPTKNMGATHKKMTPILKTHTLFIFRIGPTFIPELNII